VEVSQYSGSKKAHAIKNLLDNPVYRMLVDSTDGVIRVEKGRLVQDKPTEKDTGNSQIHTLFIILGYNFKNKWGKG